MNEQIVTVNLIPDLSAPAVVRVSQYDVGRPLAFKVLDGTNVASLGATVTTTIVGTKPSGLGFSVVGTLDGNIVTVDTTLAMTQECGMIPAEIRFTTFTPATVIGTANFILAVEKTPHAEGTTDGTLETMDDIQSQVDDLDDRVTALEGGGGGGGGGGSSVSPYTSNPSALGTASAGSVNQYSRGDHVHPMPTATQIGAIPAPSSPTTGAFLVWNGSAWVAQTLSTWQGGSY